MSKKKNQQNMCNYWNLKSIVEENTGEKDPVEAVQDAAMSREEVARIWV